jgi:glycosyltransferase involved in cell wall biosynthesis
VAQLVFARALLGLLVRAALRNTDLLHIHLSIRGSSIRKSIIGSVARACKIPYVVHLHGIETVGFWEDAGPRLAAALERLFAGSVGVVVMGRYWRDVITRRVPAVIDRIVILPNATPDPVAVKPASPRSGRVQVTFLGQLGARKGTPTLVAALSRLAGRSDWSAVIAGDGDVAQTRAQIRDLGLADRVEVPGWLGVEAREAVFGTTDILVLPSTAENLPMVVMEALARGIAVIATPVGALPEVIISGENGLLVPVGDVETLATQIARLIDDPALRGALGSAARRHHEERYAFDAYISQLIAIWRNVLPKKSGSLLAEPAAQRFEQHQENELRR